MRCAAVEHGGRPAGGNQGAVLDSSAFVVDGNLSRGVLFTNIGAVQHSEFPFTPPDAVVPANDQGGRTIELIFRINF